MDQNIFFNASKLRNSVKTVISKTEPTKMINEGDKFQKLPYKLHRSNKKVIEQGEK